MVGRSCHKYHFCRVCRDKSMLVAPKPLPWHVRRDKLTFTTTKHVFVTTKQVFCCDKNLLYVFVATEIFCLDKSFVVVSILLSWQSFCHNKNDTCGSSHESYFSRPFHLSTIIIKFSLSTMAAKTAISPMLSCLERTANCPNLKTLWTLTQCSSRSLWACPRKKKKTDPSTNAPEWPWRTGDHRWWRNPSNGCRWLLLSALCDRCPWTCDTDQGRKRQQQQEKLMLAS